MSKLPVSLQLRSVRDQTRKDFAAVESNGAAQWYIVEVEQYDHPSFESVRIPLKQLRKWGEV